MHNRNHDDERSGDATGWSAFPAGALIGAAAALLFAPQLGTELRGMLRNYTNRAKENLVNKGPEAWDTPMERGREYYDKGEEVVRDAGRSEKDFAKQAQDGAEGRQR